MSAHYEARAEVDHGGGWVIFAGAILALAGVMRIFDAIWAFRYKGAVPEGLQSGLVGSTLTNYGWLWLIVGLVLIACGVGVMVRWQPARWVGVVAGGIAAFTAIWWIPFYPVWSLVYVGLGVLVMYALAAHGEHLPGRHSAA